MREEDQEKESEDALAAKARAKALRAKEVRPLPGRMLQVAHRSLPPERATRGLQIGIRCRPDAATTAGTGTLSPADAPSFRSHCCSQGFAGALMREGVLSESERRGCGA